MLAVDANGTLNLIIIDFDLSVSLYIAFGDKNAIERSRGMSVRFVAPEHLLNVDYNFMRLTPGYLEQLYACL
jgi:hypothetical protein